MYTEPDIRENNIHNESEMRPSIQNRKRRISWRVIGVCVGVIAIIGIGVYLYMRSNVNNPQQTTAREAEKLVKEIGALILLPEGETPTVATVTDPAKLVDQSFFKNAKQGDEVLIYAQTKKIILYRQSDNKIIEVANLSIGSE